MEVFYEKNATPLNIQKSLVWGFFLPGYQIYFFDCPAVPCLVLATANSLNASQYHINPLPERIPWN